MKCGDNGGRTLDGQPCGQDLGPGRTRCVWHPVDASPSHRRELAIRGAVAARLSTLRRLPPGAANPDFATRESIVKWAEETAGKVLRGELDPKLSAEARGHAQLALAARTAEAQEKLVDGLLRLEHGGNALLLLGRLQEGFSGGPRRPLPGAGKVLTLPAVPDGDAS